MLPEAHTELHALEERHWWYVGARAVYRTLLDIGLGEPGQNRRLLEIGCGSGGNLALLSEYGATVGAELAALPLRMVATRPDLGLVQASATALPFAPRTFEAVNLLGVIEHLENDSLALQEAVRVCKPGGAVILLTSALPILWSHHDEANGHQRRYRRRQLLDLLQNQGLRPLRISYQNFFTFFPTLLVRIWQRRKPAQPRYDMSKPPAIINAILIFLLRFEAWFIRYLPLPIGVDLVTVCTPLEGE